MAWGAQVPLCYCRRDTAIAGGLSNKIRAAVMKPIVDLQHWLYGGMAASLGDLSSGDQRAIFLAMAAAVLFGAVHALMPGHGKTVLVSYHLDSQLRCLRASPTQRSSP